MEGRHGKELLKCGDTVGELTVIELSHGYRKGNLYYKCECSCGNTRYVRDNRMHLYRDCGGQVHSQEQRKCEATEKLNLDKTLSVLNITSSDNTFTKMTLQFTLTCNTCGLVFQTSYKSRWNRNGTHCPTCSGKPITDNETLSAVVKSLGYTLVNVYYKSFSGHHRRMLKVECEGGHVRECDLVYLRYRPKCSLCNPPKNATLTEDKIRETCESKNLQLLDFYKIGKYNYVKVMCQEGHLWEPLFSNLSKDDRGCPECRRKEELLCIFLYLQELTDSHGTKYLKYGLTRNEPQYRLEKQKKGSNMEHEMIMISALEPELAVKLEAWLKRNLPKEDLGYKFDGYTEVVSFRHRLFLMLYISHGFAAEVSNIDNYVGYVEGLCENFSNRC